MSTESNLSFSGRRRLLKYGAALSAAAALHVVAGCKPVAAPATELTALSASELSTARPLAPATMRIAFSGHVVTDLCIRDGACAEVCPVECIVPGQPEDEWPWYYIDPDTCIDCGACIPECPVAAIFPAEDLPEDKAYCADLNALFFTDGPGYSALDM